MKTYSRDNKDREKKSPSVKRVGNPGAGSACPRPEDTGLSDEAGGGPRGPTGYTEGQAANFPVTWEHPRFKGHVVPVTLTQCCLPGCKQPDNGKTSGAGFQ